MTPNETTAWAVVAALKAHDIDSVIAGGAARDFIAGKQPKDYDIIILGSTTEDAVRNVLMHTDMCFEEYGENTEGTSMAGSEHLDYVFKVLGVVDIIAQSEIVNTPEEAVENFDCTLNMAWFSAPGVVHQHRLFPYPGDRIVMLPKADDPVNRSCYLAEKFPEYRWPYTLLNTGYAQESPRPHWPVWPYLKGTP